MAAAIKGRCEIANPLAAKSPQFAGEAKSVIWCFLDGGPSHLDLFDPKPTLTKYAGQPLPESFPAPDDGHGQDGVHAADGEPAEV